MSKLKSMEEMRTAAYWDSNPVEHYEQIRLRGAISRGHAKEFSISGKSYAYKEGELFRLKELWR